VSYVCKTLWPVPGAWQGLNAHEWSFLASMVWTENRESMVPNGNSRNCNQKKGWMNTQKAKTTYTHYTSSPSSNSPTMEVSSNEGLTWSQLGLTAASQYPVLLGHIPKDNHAQLINTPIGLNVSLAISLQFSSLHLWGNLSISMLWAAQVHTKLFQNVQGEVCMLNM
jgi:hypothetical protein